MAEHLPAREVSRVMGCEGKGIEGIVKMRGVILMFYKMLEM